MPPLALGLRAAVAGKAHATGRGLLPGVELPDRRAAGVITAGLRGRTVGFSPPAVLSAACARVAGRGGAEGSREALTTARSASPRQGRPGPP
ncbi:hypothetical protein V1227_30180 [Lentzea sp. DG1S-22]|uniref:hypothetical protein n=1 Tax=Lentzea sp. DG1S-22 TaxID=3108822 RepID=UPI002E767E6D|nr:hypothetical protein [Lentzea sp. DG1S-22]WVH79275.1 hypothetical protein V1227_30180 [Lentzea sp. DG1S-22]